MKNQNRIGLITAALFALAINATAGTSVLEWDAPAPPVVPGERTPEETAAIMAEAAVTEYRVYAMRNGKRELVGTTPANVLTFEATVPESPAVFAVSAVNKVGESPLSNLAAGGVNIPGSPVLRVRVTVEVTAGGALLTPATVPAPVATR